MGSMTHEGAKRGRTPATASVREEVRRLLTAGRKVPLDYATIAERVQRKVKGSKTSARAVASIACALRREGAELPDRRRRQHA